MASVGSSSDWRTRRLTTGITTDSDATASSTPVHTSSARQNDHATLTAIIGTAAPMTAPVSATNREEVISISAVERVKIAITAPHSPVETRYAATIARRVDRSFNTPSRAAGGVIEAAWTSTMVSGAMRSSERPGATSSGAGPAAVMSRLTPAA
jgi:hypothetical protein